MAADAQISSSGSDNERVVATIGNWQRKLLDVSKRNRALNFRPNKVTTVTIVDEQPAEVFRQLYLQERRMHFAPAPAQAEPPSETSAAINTSDVTNEIADESAPSFDFTPYNAAELDPRHTD
ncbi:MAG TPA: DUF4011 domain-containing protein, partial [Pyrinomonadaceae bacterium]|nr:DUF4011 domain-containing protein [Pyrinomonadaceae bacterium]